MIHSDHRRKGVIYGFQPHGTFVSQRYADTGNLYCFRRSTRASLRNAQTDEQELESIRGSHVGLNRIETLVLFQCTNDLDEAWCTLKGRLRHVPFEHPEQAGGISPKWIKPLHEVGDNWFCSDVGPKAFAQWLAGPVGYVPPSEEELAQITLAKISRELEAGANVQVAGDELVIGPVSSQFAARAVLGLIESRVHTERTDYLIATQQFQPGQKRFKGPGF